MKIQNAATAYDSARKGRIWLDLQESPTSVLQDFERVALNRYPDGGSSKLKAALAEYCGVSAENIAVGNGSDELISLLVLAFGDGGVAFFEPTFSMYKTYCSNFGKQFKALELDGKFQPELCQEAKKAGLVFLCSPNSPTGNVLDEKRFLEFAKQCAGILVVDEAYYEYCNKSFQKYLGRFGRLVILRTLSKAWGLAGLRVGYLIAGKEIAGGIDKIRSPFNVNALSQFLAEKAVRSGQERMRSNVSKTVENREYLKAQLWKRGFFPLPSEANFLCVRCPADAGKTYSELLEKGIAVKNVSGPGQPANCLRISIGSKEELDFLLAAIDGNTVD